ncbi:CAP domain-containing protein [Streptomyces sp. GMY02]|uniref:CAP domain-containing protein n=1 Tax=Streptomyces sp. GMY02 TaxID=1333528 RepID=UPI001C2C1CD1|nr:CAP domain-containing protein [Streptomyces sp. GMY02]QXE34459.1 CAP domain-containing protein [Streptomyces sp. GMY02]
MGRHRRSAAPAAPAMPAAGEYDGTAAVRHRGGARRKGRAVAPIRTGLLGASAAMAVGAVAVASGLLPGGDEYTVGGSAPDGRISTEGASEPAQQGGASAEPTRETSASPSVTATPTGSPSKRATPTAAKPSVPAQRTKTTAPATPKPEAEPKRQSASPFVSKTPVPEQTTKRAVETPAAPSSTAAAVLGLVNAERAQAGCGPVKADAGLTALAQDFSEDMAARGFFDHTDPDGRTPWDRAESAGVEGLGGENIARGQATAQAVMDSWMNSEGHRANILNCDYTRLGVGVHTGSGGPWWTQDFGF